MELNNKNRFMVNPVNLDISRSKINNPYGNKLTLNAGKLVPFYLHEVIPGETLKLDYSSVIRSITPTAPVMDNAFIDFYFFWVPHRLATAGEKDWQKVCGENVSGYWAPSSETTLLSSGNTTDIKNLTSETIGSTTYKISPQSLLNYLGCPVLPSSRVGTQTGNTSGVINTLAARGYLNIYNEFFRDQNVQAPVSFAAANLGLSDSNANSCVLSVNKFHDLFTSVLPSPQKGDSVLLPLGSKAPVFADASNDLPLTYQVGPVKYKRSTTGSTTVSNQTVSSLSNIFNQVSSDVKGWDSGINRVGTSDIGYSGAVAAGDAGDTFAERVQSSGYAPSEYNTYLYPVNLWADLSNATASSVNALRNAFAIQRFLEKSARGGSRYFETLLVHFGCSNPDLVLQRPEYLSGKRVPLTMSQVAQTSSTDSTSPIGYTGAFSNTSMNDYAFTKSFGEYGYVFGLCCIRNSQSYSQGIPKTFLRNRQFDFYWPVFANLGEAAIEKRQLFFGSSGSDNTAVFGYQEAWAEYRYRVNTVSGYFNPDAGDTFLSAWTYTNKFTTYPTLNSTFMKQDRDQIDETLVIQDNPYQFYMDIFFNETDTLPMPLYSIPGLIDHH